LLVGESVAAAGVNGAVSALAVAADDLAVVADAAGVVELFRVATRTKPDLGHAVTTS
jgi:hypothetical protein